MRDFSFLTDTMELYDHKNLKDERMLFKKVYHFPYSQSSFEGYTACATISSYMCVYFINLEGEDPEIEYVDKYMKYSIKVWKNNHADTLECWRTIYDRNKTLNSNLELIKECSAIITKDPNDMDKYEDFEMVDIDSAIEELFSLSVDNGGFCVAIATYDIYTTSIYIQGYKAWIFDSHNRNKMGFFPSSADDDGAVLVCCNNSIALKNHIINLYGIYDENEDISREYLNISVFKKKQ